MKIKFVKVIIYIFLFCVILSNLYATSTKKVIVGEVKSLDNDRKESVYDVEIAWESMEFVYNETKDIKWDNKENEYNIVNETEWINENNKILIKNFSDKPINVKLSYEQTNNSLDIKGSFNKDKVKIEKNKQEMITFNISGKISSNLDEYIKVGKINIVVQ